MKDIHFIFLLIWNAFVKLFLFCFISMIPNQASDGTMYECLSTKQHYNNTKWHAENIQNKAFFCLKVYRRKKFIHFPKQKYKNVTIFLLVFVELICSISHQLAISDILTFYFDFCSFIHSFNIVVNVCKRWMLLKKKRTRTELEKKIKNKFVYVCLPVWRTI